MPKRKPTPKKRPPPKPTTKGFSCPECRGHRLHVTHTRKPVAGLIVRYRTCSVCGLCEVTEERKAKTRKANGVKSEKARKRKDSPPLAAGDRQPPTH